MTATHTFHRVSLPALRRIAQELAFAVKPGDAILLHGDLGAGKTTFAREMILAIAPETSEVPSPTFTLVQSYISPRMAIAHFDLYRLSSPDELDELGLDDALKSGIALVEWPERAGDALPADALNIGLADAGSVDGGDELRTLTLTASGDWVPRLDRLVAIHEFLVTNGFPPGAADVRHLQGDASTRRYAIVEPHAAAPWILMDSPRQPDGPPIRDGKPYSRIAHLAEDVRAFVAVDGALRAAGLSAPEIRASDLDRGLLLIEHLGDRVFGTEINRHPETQPRIWQAGVDVLVKLREVTPPLAIEFPDGTSHALPCYDAGALSIETELLVDWYWPALYGSPIETDTRAAYLAAWKPVIERLTALPSGWVLRDYHSPNLLWLPERAGVRNVGLIDFQDAMRGPHAYDLVSLLQDARIDVADWLETDLLDHYCREVHAHDACFDEQEFRFAYAALGAQRNTKILGIFARLSRRDGKHAYLAHIPRIWRYLQRDLAHPELSSLLAWYDTHLPAESRSRDLRL